MRCKEPSFSWTAPRECVKSAISSQSIKVGKGRFVLICTLSTIMTGTHPVESDSGEKSQAYYGVRTYSRAHIYIYGLEERERWHLQQELRRHVEMLESRPRGIDILGPYNILTILNFQVHDSRFDW
jgi:hypothetical protein